MIVSSDDAREALAAVKATEQRVYEVARRRRIGPSLALLGFIGLVGLGLQSRLSELWFGAKLISGNSGLVIIITCLFAAIWLMRRVCPPISLKHNTYAFLLPALAGFVAGRLESIFRTYSGVTDISAASVLAGFVIGLSITLATMLWLGRWHAFAALALILGIGGIFAYERVLEVRFAYLALLCGFVLLPTGIWMISEDRQHGA
ncbi:MAG: hypothetical protein INF18_12830 [Methylobacterium sp.]|nr:hypothetical protein [Methylobacterium sp.]MCA3639388.1 hypothetical protein [Methylobacterium sp.]